MAVISGLSKTGYSDAMQSKTRVKVNVTEDGYIAREGDTVSGSKNFQINQANPNNSLDDNNKLLNFFINLVGGTILTQTNVASVTWEV